MANRFVLNEMSYHGTDAIQEIAGEAQSRKFQKAFVCSDPDLIKFGVTKKVLDVLDKANLAYEVYSEIKPNPTIENVQTGVAAYKKSGADYLIAIGGGSSMDTAKAIGIIINNPEFEDVVSLEGVAPRGWRAYEEQICTNFCGSDHCRNSSRSDHQLCDHRCSKKSQNGLCRSERYSSSGICGSRYDVFYAEGIDSSHWYGCADTCD